MRFFRDGDQVVVTKDDFVDLQESPAVFVPADSEAGQIIESAGIRFLPVGDLVTIHNLLREGGGEFNQPGG